MGMPKSLVSSSTRCTCGPKSSGGASRVPCTAVKVVAEGLAGQVDGHGHVVRAALQEELQQHAGEAEHGVRRLAGDRAVQAAADGEVGAENLRVAIDQIEGFGIAGIIGNDE